jgi:hypothetical protein
LRPQKQSTRFFATSPGLEEFERIVKRVLSDTN